MVTQQQVQKGQYWTMRFQPTEKQSSAGYDKNVLTHKLLSMTLHKRRLSEPTMTT